MKSKIIISLISLSCSLSCLSQQLITIRTDGIYNTLDPAKKKSGKAATGHYTTFCFVVFKSDHAVFRQNGATLDSVPFTCAYYKHADRKAGGYYKIKGDSIFAYIETTFVLSGARYRSYFAHYSGRIQNNDTITGWKIVPPYPHKIHKTELNMVENSEEFNPQTLYFIRTTSVECLVTGIEKK